MRRDDTSTLAGTAPGVPVRLASVDLTGPVRLRLAEFGLRRGALVTVLSRAAGGGRVVGVDGNRIALDRGTASRLGVTSPDADTHRVA
ncbi:MAG: FeoA domain-containing protein [Jatrophihabitans sp.]|uniref:FeoA domain-containing protein n=1 Tax=Jatrophihabitans sp. TaxID=1932789 RepID=UPI003F813D5F